MISRVGTSCGRSPGGEFNYLLLFSFRMQSTENILFVRKKHHHHHDDDDDEDRKDKKDRDEDEDDGKSVCLLIQSLGWVFYLNFSFLFRRPSSQT